jgi:hypothetical protein
VDIEKGIANRKIKDKVYLIPIGRLDFYKLANDNDRRI